MVSVLSDSVKSKERALQNIKAIEVKRPYLKLKAYISNHN